MPRRIDFEGEDYCHFHETMECSSKRKPFMDHLLLLNNYSSQLLQWSQMFDSMDCVSNGNLKGKLSLRAEQKCVKTMRRFLSAVEDLSCKISDDLKLDVF